MQRSKFDSKDLDYSTLEQSSKYKHLPPPPGFSKSVSHPRPSSKAVSTVSYNALKEKRAWDFAIGPAKNLPMQAFMLYMSGGGVQIFSMGIVFMLLSAPFRNILGMNEAFAQFAPSKSNAKALTTLPLQKIVYLLCNLLTLAVGLWKCRSMGLLPTGTGDWLAFETRGQTLVKYIEDFALTLIMALTSPLIAIFQYTLQPIAPFTWFGLSVSTLDLVATVRLCLVLRQIKDTLYQQHVQKNTANNVESRSFTRSVATTLIVVYGGEAVAAPMLGIPPSFMTSGTFPLLYTAAQAIVDFLPAVPLPSLQLELPLAVVDGFTRAYLLCNLIPPAVTTNASQLISTSPWCLLASSFLIANGGFFFTNLFSFLNPTPLSLQTPPEMQAYGWTTVDLWCAPLVTGIYALLTHAQPFWADAHGLITELLGGKTGEKAVVAPVDNEVARALCTMILMSLFTTRTVKNFTNLFNQPVVKTAAKKRTPKEKTQ